MAAPKSTPPIMLAPDFLSALSGISWQQVTCSMAPPARPRQKASAPALTCPSSNPAAAPSTVGTPLITANGEHQAQANQPGACHACADGQPFGEVVQRNACAHQLARLLLIVIRMNQGAEQQHAHDAGNQAQRAPQGVFFHGVRQQFKAHNGQHQPRRGTEHALEAQIGNTGEHDAHQAAQARAHHARKECRQQYIQRVFHNTSQFNRENPINL